MFLFSCVISPVLLESSLVVLVVDMDDHLIPHPYVVRLILYVACFLLYSITPSRPVNQTQSIEIFDNVERDTKDGENQSRTLMWLTFRGRRHLYLIEEAAWRSHYSVP